mmetsp:Transcript_1141/g.2812  ORF Transcript_1141/g.2812 Transcript_1141/m.2812 type:complete len:243 (-) Transcript_1141:46-774(-)
MHHPSAHDIHWRDTRFRRPRRTLSSMPAVRDAEREKEVEREFPSAAALPELDVDWEEELLLLLLLLLEEEEELPLTSISILMESPLGRLWDVAMTGIGTASEGKPPRRGLGYAPEVSNVAPTSLSRIMRRIDTVDGALESSISNDGMRFGLGAPREVQHRTSSCRPRRRRPDATFSIEPHGPLDVPQPSREMPGGPPPSSSAESNSAPSSSGAFLALIADRSDAPTRDGSSDCRELRGPPRS